MRRVAASFVMLLAANAAAQDALRTLKLAENVYAILQSADNRFNDSNSVLIIGPSSAIVVDTQVDPGSSRRVIAEIKKITDKPVRQVIATHWHGDHFQGNQAYREAYPGVEFAAHADAESDMRTRAPKMRDEDVARLKKLRPDWRRLIGTRWCRDTVTFVAGRITCVRSPAFSRPSMPMFNARWPTD